MNRKAEKAAARQSDMDRLRQGEPPERLARENSLIEPLLASGLRFRIVSIGGRRFGRNAG